MNSSWESFLARVFPPSTITLLKCQTTSLPETKVSRLVSFTHNVCAPSMSWDEVRLRVYLDTTRVLFLVATSHSVWFLPSEGPGCCSVSLLYILCVIKKTQKEQFLMISLFLFGIIGLTAGPVRRNNINNAAGAPEGFSHVLHFTQRSRVTKSMLLVA